VVNALPSGLAVSPRAVANLKRSLVLATAIGTLALLILALLGHPLAGFFVVLGLAFGVLNTWLTQRSVIRYGEKRSKGGFVSGMLARLGLLTVASIGAVALVRPDGIGLLGGIAIFQMIVLVGAAVPVLRELRR
jgi:ATP synthase I subunit